jgi:hypothetical protein
MSTIKWNERMGWHRANIARERQKRHLGRPVYHIYAERAHAER